MPPNVVSLLRLITAPALGYGVVEGMWGPVLLGVAVSGWSDWLDGYLARRYNVTSVLGSYLDPLADKALVACLVVALAHEGLLPLWMASLFVGRDLAIVGGAFFFRAYSLGFKWRSWREYFSVDGSAGGAGRGLPKVEPLMVSKVNTALQIGLIGACLSQGAFQWPGEEAVHYLGLLTAGTTVASAAAYALNYRAVLGHRP